MPAWFPLVGCNLAKKWVPTDYFAWGGKTLCLSQLMCQGNGKKEMEGVCVCVRVCTRMRERHAWNPHGRKRDLGELLGSPYVTGIW